MKERLCPFCEKPIHSVCKKNGEFHHLVGCSKNKGLHYTNSDLTIKYICFNYEFVTRDWLQEQIDNEIPIYEIDNKFFDGINTARKLCKLWDIKTRSLKEASNTKRTRSKYMNTCLDKYGTINTLGEGSTGRKKRDQTMKEKYGVVNFFTVPNFQDFLKERLGDEEYHLRKSNRSKKVWESKTDDERIAWIEKSILLKRPNGRLAGTNSSKMEVEFLTKLIEYGFELDTQFKLKKGLDKKGCTHYYYYDARLKDSNILIEFNGDYWHANPLIYKEDDLISTRSGKKLVKEIWERDKQKIKTAENNGFKVIIIWESEYLNLDTIELIFDKLCEVGYENYKIKEHQED